MGKIDVVDAAPMLYQYVRDKRGHKIGVVIAVGSGQVGWALCKKPSTIIVEDETITSDDISKKYGKNAYVRKIVLVDRPGDHFDLDKAFAIAFKKVGKDTNIPNSVKAIYDSLMDRSRRYFEPEKYSRRLKEKTETDAANA